VLIFRNKLQTEHELILEADSHEAISPNSKSELDEDTMAGIIIIIIMQVMIKTQCEKKVYSHLQNYTFTLIKTKILPLYHIHELPSIM
jgi:hypothetical protein